MANVVCGKCGALVSTHPDYLPRLWYACRLRRQCSCRPDRGRIQDALTSEKGQH